MKAKRILSVILAVAMMISLLPAIAFSASAEDPIELQYIFNQVAGGASGKNALSLRASPAPAKASSSEIAAATVRE